MRHLIPTDLRPLHLVAIAAGICIAVLIAGTAGTLITTGA